MKMQKWKQPKSFLVLWQSPNFYDYKKFKTDFIGVGAQYKPLPLGNEVSLDHRE